MAGNPNPSPATRFKAGQAANPGGRTSESLRRDRDTAEKSSQLRNVLISRTMEILKSDPLAPIELSTELLRLLKDSEDRAHGTPRQAVDIDASGTITINIASNDAGL